jgi:hypothetical protein
MRKLLRNRRGSVAFATVIALIPLIGFVALGAEAGSWYVTKQQAQNAADAAAYAGALTLACQLSSSTIACADTQSVNYRGEQFAAQNAFCNTGGTSYPGAICPPPSAGTTQSVEIDQPTSKRVRAIISQTQPAYLAALFGPSPVTIGATAIAEVQGLAQPPCILALHDPITFQGSPTMTSPDCGIASNSTATNAIGFTGNNGIKFEAPSYTVGGCSQTASSGTACTTVQTYQQSFPDPLGALNTAMAALKLTDFPKGPCKVSAATPTLPASYEAGQCYNTGTSLSSALNGTYYFTGDVKVSGSPTITGTATLIFFGGATLTITGNPTIQLTAMSSPTGPSTLSSVASLMAGLLIYDGEPKQNNKTVNISGTSASYFNGTVYVPNAPVTYGGNSTSAAPNPGCYQVIAYGVNFQGNTNLDNKGCPWQTNSGGAKPDVQTVRLVPS